MGITESREVFTDILGEDSSDEEYEDEGIPLAWVYSIFFFYLGHLTGN